MLKGRDSLGVFNLEVVLINYVYVGGRASCEVCGEALVASRVRYLKKPKLSGYVAKAKSLLIRNKKTGKYIRTIGVTCGCYSKVHRQVAHIESGQGAQR